MKKPKKMYKKNGELTKAGVAYKASLRAQRAPRVQSGPNEGQFKKTTKRKSTRRKSTRRKSRKSSGGNFISRMLSGSL